MLHGFARLALFAEGTAKPLSDYTGNRELVSCRAFLSHFSRRLSINLEPSPPRTFSPSPFCNCCVWFKKRASALIKLYSQKYYFFKFLYYR